MEALVFFYMIVATLLFFGALITFMSEAYDYRRGLGDSHRRNALICLAVVPGSFVWPLAAVGYILYYFFGNLRAVIVGEK